MSPCLASLYNFICVPLATSQAMLEWRNWYSYLTLNLIVEKIWWFIMLCFLNTLSLTNLVEFSSLVLMSQPSFKLVAMFRFIRDLMPRPSWSLSWKAFYPVVVTILMEMTFPFHMKIVDDFTMLISKLIGQ